MKSGIDQLPSVRLDRAEAAIGSYIETPIVSSSPLALCQRKHVKADTLENVASLRINRRESGDRSVAICVAVNCGPAGMKPAETARAFADVRKKLRVLTSRALFR